MKNPIVEIAAGIRAASERGRAVESFRSRFSSFAERHAESSLKSDHEKAESRRLQEGAKNADSDASGEGTENHTTEGDEVPTGADFESSRDTGSEQMGQEGETAPENASEPASDGVAEDAEKGDEAEPEPDPEVVAEREREAKRQASLEKAESKAKAKLANARNSRKKK